MPPSATPQVLLSPAELSYIHTSLSHSPPIRSDGRAATQFRPLVAETGILPGTNGSARICFADGSEAIVGVKAEIEKLPPPDIPFVTAEVDNDSKDTEPGKPLSKKAKKNDWNAWVDVDVELPGYRDDDAMPMLLAAILTEALLSDGHYPERLCINQRFRWKLYLDILLLSQPLSYPLPLLSLTAHLALLATRIPQLKSEEDEDPLFDDDWEASTYLYPRGDGAISRPPVTLLVMAVKENIIFDPSREELAVADVILAVSVSGASRKEDQVDRSRNLRLLAVRTIDPPSRITHPGLPTVTDVATGGSATTLEETNTKMEVLDIEGVWQPHRGGTSRKLISAMIHQVLEAGGVAEEVLDGLDTVGLS